MEFLKSGQCSLSKTMPIMYLAEIREAYGITATIIKSRTRKRFHPKENRNGFAVGKVHRQTVFQSIPLERVPSTQELESGQFAVDGNRLIFSPAETDDGTAVVNYSYRVTV